MGSIFLSGTQEGDKWQKEKKSHVDFLCEMFLLVQTFGKFDCTITDNWETKTVLWCMNKDIRINIDLIICRCSISAQESIHKKQIFIPENLQSANGRTDTSLCSKEQGGVRDAVWGGDVGRIETSYSFKAIYGICLYELCRKYCISWEWLHRKET